MFTQRVSLTSQDARQVSASQQHKLGTIAESADGRAFRYSQAGASNLAAGLVNVAPARLANHSNIAVAVDTAAGARKVTVTLGATAATQDQYKHGYLVVNDGAGVGVAYCITGNAAAASGTSCDVYLEEAVAISLTAASSKVSLQPSAFSGAIVHPGSSTAFLASGSNNVAVAAGSYFWSQVRGVASVLSDGVIAKGVESVLTTNAIAGATITRGTNTTVAAVGIAVEATVDTKYYPQRLVLE